MSTAIGDSGLFRESTGKTETNKTNVTIKHAVHRQNKRGKSKEGGKRKSEQGLQKLEHSLSPSETTDDKVNSSQKIEPVT